ncbi:MAG: histone deacetylase [Candidatus Thorarchaeota archaeon]
MPTDLLYHEEFTKHVMSPSHPERPERLVSAMSHIKETGLLQNSKVRLVEAVPVDLDLVYSLHEKSYIDMIRKKSESGGGFFTLDTSVNEHTYDASILAAGAGTLAMDRIMEGVTKNAYVLCRPPGHHAEHNQAFGFCFINNVAIAAKHLIRKHGVERVLIVDYDAHHGNGTQNAFYSSNQVLYIGLHQDGRTLFPGSGFPDEIGSEEGKGYNVNLAMYPGAGDISYDIAFSEIVEKICDSYRPEFILVSCGFDGHFSDPLTALGLTTSGMAMMNMRLNSMSKDFCEGQIAFFLEGGYDLDIVGKCSRNIIEELCGVGITSFNDEHTESENCTQYTESLVDRLRSNLRGIHF